MVVDAVRGREAEGASRHVEMEANKLQEEGGGDWVFPIELTYRICYYSKKKYFGTIILRHRKYFGTKQNKISLTSLYFII